MLRSRVICSARISKIVRLLEGTRRRPVYTIKQTAKAYTTPRRVIVYPICIYIFIRIRVLSTGGLGSRREYYDDDDDDDGNDVQQDDARYYDVMIYHENKKK